MNREVIYLEPEDDITDILTRLQQADKKLVALVPPKKATMLRSAVNMKLVARVAKECEKVVVVVTADPAIMKMAMLARIPVAKTLQSRPVVPTEENLKAAGIDEEAMEDVVSDADVEDMASGRPKFDQDEDEDKPEKAETVKGPVDLEINEDGLDDEKEDKKDKKADKKSKLGKNEFWQKYGKFIKIGAPIGVVAIILAVWAFVFAPAATIAVTIASSASNFNESVKFTAEVTGEEAKEGVFFAEKQAVRQKYTTELTATGEENRGEKAKGSVTVTLSFVPKNGSIANTDINAGDSFVTASGLKYHATNNASLGWDEKSALSDVPGCKSTTQTCQITASIQLEADNPGENFNVPANTEWISVGGGLKVTNSAAFNGGTTDIVKVMKQSDVDKAVDELIEKHTAEGKKELNDSAAKEFVLIEDSFKKEAVDTKPTPGVGDVVGENTKPNLTVEVEYSMYAVQKSKIKEFVKAKIDLGPDQQVYNMNDIRFVNFTSIEDSAQLKAVVSSGPIVSEDTIFEQAKGRKVGQVQSQLRSISGVDDVNIKTSFFWVNKIPKKREKVTITLEGEKQPEMKDEDQDDDNGDNKSTKGLIDNEASTEESQE